MTIHRTTSISTPVPSREAAATLAFVVLLIALTARLVFAIWEGYDGSPTYDEIADFGEAYWPMNVLVFGPAWAIGFFAQGVLAWRLAAGRGSLTTRIGACILVVGGVLFALTATAHALPYDWAANHGILDPDVGADVLERFVQEGTATLLPYILAAQATIAAGALVTAVGAGLSRTVPWWLVVATVVFVIAFLALPVEAGGAMDWVLSTAQLALWAVLGWFGWRRERTHD